MSQRTIQLAAFWKRIGDWLEKVEQWGIKVNELSVNGDSV
jgi:hypothetical protein